MSESQFGEVRRSLQQLGVEVDVMAAPINILGTRSLCVSLISTREGRPVFCFVPVGDYEEIDQVVADARSLGTAIAGFSAGGGGEPESVSGGMCVRCGGWYMSSSYAGDKEADEVTLCALCATRCAQVGLGAAAEDLGGLREAYLGEEGAGLSPEELAGSLEALIEHLDHLWSLVADPINGDEENGDED